MSSADQASVRAPRRPGGGGRALSRTQIASAAFAFIERHGLVALSMRRLAQELGIGTMTLYGYFRDKEELLDAVVDVASEEIEIPRGEGSWRNEIRALMCEVRRTLAEHPVGVLLRLRRPMLTPRSQRVAEAAMQALLKAGFSRAEAASAYRTLFSYTFGFASFSPAEDADQVRRQAEAALALLPPDEYPALSASASEAAAAMAGEAQFEFGLDLLLDGLEARRVK